MSVEEFRLGFPAIGTFTVLPASAIGVEFGAGSSLNGDFVAFELEEGSVPFGVAPGCCTFEDDLMRRS